MTIGTYLLRVKELGLSLDELDNLHTGDIFDMLVERANDYEDYPYKPTQADFGIFG